MEFNLGNYDSKNFDINTNGFDFGNVDFSIQQGTNTQEIDYAGTAEAYGELIPSNLDTGSIFLSANKTDEFEYYGDYDYGDSYSFTFGADVDTE